MVVGEIAEADLVEVEALGGELVVIVDVEPVLELGDRSRESSASRSSSGTSGRAASARRSSRSRCAVNWSATSGRLSGCDRTSPRAMSISSASVSVTASPASALVRLLVGDEDPRDRRLPAGAGDDDRVARRDPSAGDRAGDAAEIEVRAVDPLRRQAERRRAPVLLDLDALEIVHQMRALEPRRARRSAPTRCRRSGPRAEWRTASGSRAARRTCGRR